MGVKRLNRLALLTAVALIIFVVEAQLPPLAPVSGIKLGLANIASLFAMFWMGRKEGFLVLMVRIFLGTIFTGQGVSFLYSLSGGLLAFLVIAVFYRFFSLRQLWVPSILAAIVHNIGQILCAVWILHTWAVMVYLPVLICAGCLTGAFTGFAAQFLVRHKAFEKNGESV